MAENRPWAVVPDVLSPSLCQSVIDRQRDKVEPLTATQPGEKRIAEGTFFTDADIYQTLEEKYTMLPFNVKSVYSDDWEDLHFITYKTGGEYNWHADNEWLPDDDRKLTFVIPLNSGFTGGGTELMWPHPGTIVKPDVSVGSALVFPATMFHRGVPVESGVRYVLVAWAVGPQFI